MASSKVVPLLGLGVPLCAVRGQTRWAMAKGPSALPARGVVILGIASSISSQSHSLDLPPAPLPTLLPEGAPGLRAFRRVPQAALSSHWCSGQRRPAPETRRPPPGPPRPPTQTVPERRKRDDEHPHARTPSSVWGTWRRRGDRRKEAVNPELGSRDIRSRCTVLSTSECVRQLP